MYRSKFRKINGDHPLKAALPAGYVPYRVRRRHGGKVLFFNFDLAREMDLLDATSSDELSADLEKVILETFALTIINEYDLTKRTPIRKRDILPNEYMATRYLQLQHPSRTGKTSGDGRSIWNGVHVGSDGMQWDISSCGTGATCLSPAHALSGKFYRTGDPSVSYGCGLADLDDGLTNAIFAEILHRNGTPTERTLAVIGFRNNTAIVVRAAPNLLRPSHFFRLLKQSRLDELRSLVDYYIDRQARNGLESVARERKVTRYGHFLKNIAWDFARLAAHLESYYIFCWLDWDGDNVLTDGKILDYGSIRQFGLYHHEYRYDDDDRWSTSIAEQRQKARNIVQTFAQIERYISTGRRPTQASLKNHPILSYFDTMFARFKLENMLKQIGFCKRDVEYLLNEHRSNVVTALANFGFFERIKSRRGYVRVPDGITWNAIFCMRDLLRELPRHLATSWVPMDPARFLKTVRSKYATAKDARVTSARRAKIEAFQGAYMSLVAAVASRRRTSVQRIAEEIAARSAVINRYDRVTGDAMCHIGGEFARRWRSIPQDILIQLMHQFIVEQTLDPDHAPRASSMFHQILRKASGYLRENRLGI